MKNKIILLLLSSLFLLQVGCLTQRSIYNLGEHSIPKSDNLNLVQIQECIEYALIVNGWKIDDISANKIITTQTWRRHRYSITLSVSFDQEKYKIKYLTGKKINYRKSFWSDDDSANRTAVKKMDILNHIIDNRLKNPDGAIKYKKTIDNLTRNQAEYNIKRIILEQPRRKKPANVIFYDTYFKTTGVFGQSFYYDFIGIVKIRRNGAALLRKDGTIIYSFYMNSNDAALFARSIYFMKNLVQSENSNEISPQNNSTKNKLYELMQIKNEKLITKEEYDRKRNEILSEL